MATIRELIETCDAAIKGDVGKNSIESLIGVGVITDEELQSIQDAFEASGMKLGKVIGAGTYALVFELTDAKGVPLEHSVVRLTPIDTHGSLDNAGIIQTLHHVEDGEFEMTVVPRANLGRKVSDADIRHNLSVINYRPGHMDNLTDMKRKQFLWLDGMDVPVMADLSSVKSKRTQNISTGNLHDLAVQLDSNEDMLKQDKCGATEYHVLQKQADAVRDRSLGEMQARGIDVRSLTKLVRGMAISHAG